jgi:hypothetical protein
VRVIVTGSRDWPDDSAVFFTLYDALRQARWIGEVLDVIHGGCPTGADAYAAGWCAIARKLGYPVNEIVYEADWSIGRKAGPERNKRMIEAGADKVLAFNRNNSRGTSGTMKLANDAGIPVELYIITDKEAA